MRTLIIDSNILISALIKKGPTRKILTNSNMNFVFPEYGLEEVYFHKHTIVKKSRVSEREFNILLLRLLKYVNLIPLDVIVKFREEADRIMGEIDRKDTPFVALALAFNCPIWSDDNHFKKQKEVKIFTTKDILRMGTK